MASSTVRIDVTASCALSISSECSSETQSPVLCYDEVAKHTLVSYRILCVLIVIERAKNSEGISNIRRSGGHRVHEASHEQLVLVGSQAMLRGVLW